MKQMLLIVGCLALAAPAAVAGERVVPGPEADLAGGLGKQVNVRFSDGFAAGRLPQADVDGLIISGLPASEGKVCFYGKAQGLDPESDSFKDYARPDDGDVCVPLADVSIRAPEVEPTPGAPPMLAYGTDLKACRWVWSQGQGIGVWTEECSFDNGQWTVSYDAANDWFALTVNGENPYPVLRHFRLTAGLDGLLAELKSKGLVLNDAECVFQPASDQPVPRGWPAFEIVPVGQRKAAFDALPNDEVPEPPCGELGMVVDFTGFFMTQPQFPDRAVYVNLGQDGTMFDAGSVTLSK
jgi:hypothetical protein